MKIHFIGIGGIGVSALAQYYIKKGHTVSGSDLTETEITKALKKYGAKIKIGAHRAENIPFQVDLVVHSPAVARTNPELRQARNVSSSKSLKSRWRAAGEPKQQMRILSYPQALGELTQQYYTIAISGTHGKSTTAAMISLLLIEAGFDPTCIVGTKVKEFDLSIPSGTNCRVGQDTFRIKDKPVLVIEADEHMASFLNYAPDIIVLTSIEPDHIDYYKNIKNILKAFGQYLQLLPKNGIIVANKEDKNIVAVVGKSKRIVKFYAGTWIAAKELRRILRVPGEFNVANAHAALTLARALKIPDKTSYRALSKFQGTWRRFEIFELLKPVKYTLVSDYGHHPTEVRVTVQAARFKWPKKKIWLVFQPHQYQRTFYFYHDFIAILSLLPVDKLIISDIYDVAGREQAALKEKVSSEKLLAQVLKRRGREHAAGSGILPMARCVYFLERKAGKNIKGAYRKRPACERGRKISN